MLQHVYPGYVVDRNALQLALRSSCSCRLAEVAFHICLSPAMNSKADAVHFMFFFFSP